MKKSRMKRCSLLGEAEVDSIEGHNEVGVIIDFFERSNDARLAANSPYKVLMSDGIVQTHAFFADQGQFVLMHG